MTGERLDVEAIRADHATWTRPVSEFGHTGWVIEKADAQRRLALAAPRLAVEVESLRAQLAAVEALAERWKRADGRGKHAARRSGALAAQLLTVLHAKDNDVARMLADPDAYFRILRAASRSSVETGDEG